MKSVNRIADRNRIKLPIKRFPVCMGALFVALLLSGLCPGESPTPRMPELSDYPAGERFTGRPAPVKLNSAPDARMFRTVLRRQAAEGPNFAGHYRLAEWGCGSGCLSIAVVDSSTGNVVFPDNVSPIAFMHYYKDESMDRYGIVYNVKSRLLIVCGMSCEHDQDGDYYFVFENGRFREIAAQVWEPAAK